MIQVKLTGLCALLVRCASASQDVELGLNAHLDQFASDHLINGTVLAKPTASDGRELGYTFTLDCTTQVVVFGYAITTDSSGFSTKVVGSCRLRRVCADSDLDTTASHTACTLSTKALGYCDKKCTPVLGCLATKMPEDLAERLNGYKLVPIQNLEPTKITNPTHMCSPADRTETFTQASNRSSSLLADFRHYSQYAAAAYCNVKITAGNSFACDGACPLVESSNSTAVETFTGEQTDVTGFVAVDHDRREIVLSFRGSSSWNNWITDAKFGLKECDLVDGCKLHTGFHQAWEEVALRAEAGITQVLAAHKEYSVIATGHSLGGAVATIAAAYLRRDGMKVTAYTYGAPRAGNAEFANFVNSQVEVYRVTHGGDPIPHMPTLSMGYAHTSPEYWIDKRGATDNECNEGDVTVCTGIANPNCNVGTYGLEILAHTHYFGTSDACKPGFWSMFTSSTKRDNQPALDQRIKDLLMEDRQVAIDAAKERELQHSQNSDSTGLPNKVNG